MRCAARITLAALIASLPLVGTGCIPQDKYDQALMANRTLKEQLLRAENERDAALANFESALSEVSGTRFGVNDLQSQNLRRNRNPNRCRNLNRFLSQNLCHHRNPNRCRNLNRFLSQNHFRRDYRLRRHRFGWRRCPSGNY